MLTPAEEGRVRMLMSPSYAIISAKISNMGYGGVDCQYKIKSVHWECHIAGRRGIYLGNGAVVDLDEVAGSRVNLQSLVESERRVKHLGS